MRLKSGDTVVVKAGKDKGQKGKILRVLSKEGKVIVEGVNMQTKHMKAQGPTSPGGIVRSEGPIDASNVMFFCEKDKAGVRVGYNVLDNGSKVRVCKTCGTELDK